MRLLTDEVGDNIQQMEARRSKLSILLHQLLRDGPWPHPAVVPPKKGMHIILRLTSSGTTHEMRDFLTIGVRLL